MSQKLNIKQQNVILEAAIRKALVSAAKIPSNALFPTGYYKDCVITRLSEALDKVADRPARLTDEQVFWSGESSTGGE